MSAVMFVRHAWQVVFGYGREKMVGYEVLSLTHNVYTPRVMSSVYDELWCVD